MYMCVCVCIAAFAVITRRCVRIGTSERGYMCVNGAPKETQSQRSPAPALEDPTVGSRDAASPQAGLAKIAVRARRYVCIGAFGHGYICVNGAKGNGWRAWRGRRGWRPGGPTEGRTGSSGGGAKVVGKGGPGRRHFEGPATGESSVR